MSAFRRPSAASLMQAACTMRSTRGIEAGCGTPITSSSRGQSRRICRNRERRGFPQARRERRTSSRLDRPAVRRTQRLMEIVLHHLVNMGGDRPQDLLVNSVLTISAKGSIGLVTATVARLGSQGKIEDDDLICPPP